MTNYWRQTRVPDVPPMTTYHRPQWTWYRVGTLVAQGMGAAAFFALVWLTLAMVQMGAVQ